MGEYISRFKRQSVPAEVLLSALKEWFLFFPLPSSTHSRTCVFVPHLIAFSLRSITYFHCSVSNKSRLYFTHKRLTHTLSIYTVLTPPFKLCTKLPSHELCGFPNTGVYKTPRSFTPLICVRCRCTHISYVHIILQHTHTETYSTA
jgi:hypothetical protein